MDGDSGVIGMVLKYFTVNRLHKRPIGYKKGYEPTGYLLHVKTSRRAFHFSAGTVIRGNIQLVVQGREIEWVVVWKCKEGLYVSWKTRGPDIPALPRI